MILDVQKLGTEAVRNLVGLQVMIDHEPERAVEARQALEAATRLMVKHGMLDIMITIAAKQMTSD